MGFIQEDCGCVYHSDGFNNDHVIADRCYFHQGYKQVRHPAIPPAAERPLICRLHLHTVHGCLRCGFKKRVSFELVKLTAQEKERGEKELLDAWKRKHESGERHGRWLT